MAKKMFSAILVFVVGVGCTKVELTNMYDCNSINFATQTTKAVTNSVDSIMKDANGFVVYATESGSSEWYDNLDGNRYIYNSTSQTWEWESSDEPSWPVPFNTMRFYALYPMEAAGFELSESAPSQIVGDIEVEASILDQTDYLAANSGDVTSKPATGILSLNFNHIMSKISFSVLQYENVLTIIRQLGIENVINKGSYDYVGAEWCELSNSNLGSFDDYVGSSGVFAKYGVANKVDPIRSDGHSLMLIPQQGGDDDDQVPIWDGSVGADSDGEGVPSGAYISIRYRTSLDGEDVIGYALRDSSPNDTEWSMNSSQYSAYKKRNGTYTGPLYVQAGFKLSAQSLNWVAGSEYDYTIQLIETGGIHLSEYYYDLDGVNTKIRINGSPDVGDTIFTTDIKIGVTVSEWVYSDSYGCTQ